MRRAELTLLAVLLTISSAGAAAAQSTDRAASLLFFPMVVVESDRDTIIRLGNRSTRVTYARCEYTAAGAGGQAIGFDLALQRLQPTHWRASRGRAIDADDPPCDAERTDCDGAGFDPGEIPALPEGFRGDLLCVQVDRSRAPTSGNALRGSATLSDGSGDTAHYEAVGLQGMAQNDADGVLCLGGAPGEGCPRGAEYAACPETWHLGLRAEGTPLGSGENAPAVRNRLAATTCSRRSGGGSAILQILIYNEFEQRFAISAPVERTGEIALADDRVFSHETLGSDFALLRIRAVPTGPGVVIVALSDRASGDGLSAGGSAALVPYPEGARAESDRIVLPAE